MREEKKTKEKKNHVMVRDSFFLFLFEE